MSLPTLSVPVPYFRFFRQLSLISIIFLCFTDGSISPPPDTSGSGTTTSGSTYIICAWCQKAGPKLFTLKTPTLTKAFCSEYCFTQCRRASFKKNKVCDWCKHVRHTVNYVDFQVHNQHVCLSVCMYVCLWNAIKKERYKVFNSIFLCLPACASRKRRYFKTLLSFCISANSHLHKAKVKLLHKGRWLHPLVSP